MPHRRDRERDVRVGAEERERREPAQRDRGGQSASETHRARRNEPQERAAPTTVPATTSTGVTIAECDDAPARTSPAPDDERQRVEPAIDRLVTAGRARARRSARVVITAASTTSGSRPRNTHRQPNASATAPLIAGPIRPGSTHARRQHREHARLQRRRVRAPDRDVRDRRDRARADALHRSAPRRARACSARARPRRGRPRTATSPAMNGRAGPWRSASRPAATTPKRLPRKNALNTQPSRPMSCRSSSMTLRIVAIARPSKPTSVIVKTSPIVSARRPGAHTPSESVVRARTRPSCPMPAVYANRRLPRRAGAPRGRGFLTVRTCPGLWSTADWAGVAAGKAYSR